MAPILHGEPPLNQNGGFIFAFPFQSGCVALTCAGIEYACEQISELLQQGVDGLHLYTMNKPVQTKQILKMAGLRE
jgi:hypothetical protein